MPSRGRTEDPPMNILLTNDDGFFAEGIQVLLNSLSVGNSVCVIAPDVERSAQSHAMTLRTPLVLRKHGELRYACSGTPVDCVLLACHGAVPFVPDVVISGINRGPNLGSDLVYSGTAAAARQAVMSGIPGIAVSLASFSAPFRYEALAALVSEQLPRLMEMRQPDTFVNINAPDAPADFIYELAWTKPCRRIYKDTLKVFEGPDGFTYCFYTDGSVHSIEETDSDEHAVRLGRAAASLVCVHPLAIEYKMPGKPDVQLEYVGDNS